MCPTPQHFRSSTVIWLIAICCCLVLTGCGLTPKQRAAISKFSATTVGLTDQMGENFVQTRDDVIVLRTVMVELESGSVRLDDPAADLDGPLDVEQVEKRLKAAAALRRFGQLLETLSTDDQTGQIQAAADNFLTSLRKVEGVRLSDEKSQAIAQLITKVGGIFIEYKRKRALRSVVVESKQPVQSLANLIAEDFDPNKLFWLGALVETQRSITNTLRERMEFVVAGQPVRPGDANSPKWSESEVSLRQNKYRALRIDSEERVKRARVISSKTRDALASFRDAHNDLFVMMQSPKTSLDELDGFVAEIDSLLRLSRILRQNDRR